MHTRICEGKPYVLCKLIYKLEILGCAQDASFFVCQTLDTELGFYNIG